MITTTKIFKKSNKRLKEKAEKQSGINLDAITSRKIELITQIEEQIGEDKSKRLNYKVWLKQIEMIAIYLYKNQIKL